MQAQHNRARIWIDVDNSPHVPLFLPIIRELERQGHETVVTARDCFQTCELLDAAGVPYHKIGRHYGKRLVLKAVGLLVRGVQLCRFGRKQAFGAAVSHGSRSLILAGYMLRLPTVNMFDYEYSRFGILTNAPAKQLIPSVIPDSALPPSLPPDKVVRYPGLKEHITTSGFSPEVGYLERILGLDSDKIVITLRPPASEAHYHNPESDGILDDLLPRLLKRDDVTTIALPRTEKQKQQLLKVAADGTKGLVIPPMALDGLNLVYCSDLVISGGGTMIREAAVLGVPAYSFFRGAIGAVDHCLVAEGKLHLVESSKDIEKIPIKKRKCPAGPPVSGGKNATVLEFVVDEILSTVGVRD